MKLIHEHVEQAVHFEKMAAEASDPAFKAQLLKQAKAYRRLAAERAKQLHVPVPADPPQSN
jgi:hypothetical protein